MDVRVEVLASDLLSDLRRARGLSGITRRQIELVCDEVVTKFKSERSLLEIGAPVTIFGDIHGQFADMLAFMEGKSGWPSRDNTLLFLGDYVDRGKQSIETVLWLFCTKIRLPGSIYMLRGNHETPEVNGMYGFREECLSHYGPVDGDLIWKKFNSVFAYLPIAAVVGKHIFCVHGGISESLRTMHDIAAIERPIEHIPDRGLLCDLLWADPRPGTGFRESERGASFVFGEDVALRFIRDNDFDLICRAHQCVERGFEFPFMPDMFVVTIFSAPDYCSALGDGEGYQNGAAIMGVSADLACRFETIAGKSVEVPPDSR